MVPGRYHANHRDTHGAGRTEVTPTNPDMLGRWPSPRGGEHRVPPRRWPGPRRRARLAFGNRTGQPAVEARARSSRATGLSLLPRCASSYARRAVVFGPRCCTATTVRTFPATSGKPPRRIEKRHFALPGLARAKEGSWSIYRATWKTNPLEATVPKKSVSAGSVCPMYRVSRAAM